MAINHSGKNKSASNIWQLSVYTSAQVYCTKAPISKISSEDHHAKPYPESIFLNIESCTLVLLQSAASPLHQASHAPEQYIQPLLQHKASIGKGSIKIRQQYMVLHACAVKRSPGVLVSSCQPLQLYVNKGHAGISRYYKRKERRKDTHRRRTHTDEHTTQESTQPVP